MVNVRIIKMKKVNDKLTISVNKRIKDDFKDFCEARGLKIGKQIEIIMKDILEDNDAKNGGKSS